MKDAPGRAGWRVNLSLVKMNFGVRALCVEETSDERTTSPRINRDASSRIGLAEATIGLARVGRRGGRRGSRSWPLAFGHGTLAGDVEDVALRRDVRRHDDLLAPQVIPCRMLPNTTAGQSLHLTSDFPDRSQFHPLSAPIPVKESIHCVGIGGLDHGIPDG